MIKESVLRYILRPILLYTLDFFALKNTSHIIRFIKKDSIIYFFDKRNYILLQGDNVCVNITLYLI